MAKLIHELSNAHGYHTGRYVLVLDDGSEFVVAHFRQGVDGWFETSPERATRREFQASDGRHYRLDLIAPEHQTLEPAQLVLQLSSAITLSRLHVQKPVDPATKNVAPPEDEDGRPRSLTPS
jgi:hypothetical protein